MANASGIQWVVSPDVLIEAIEKYGAQVFIAIYAVAQYIATQAQNDMRQNAPWTDRTGNARNGLFSLAEQTAVEVVTIYFSHGHSVNYGIFLETSHGMSYAIIMPTMQRIMPQLETMLNNIF